MINRRQFDKVLLLGALSGVGCSKLPAQLTTSVEDAGTWSQWAGPQRDFVVRDLEPEGISQPPELLWKRELGKGHAAVICSGEFGYSMHLDGDREVIQKFQLGNGDVVWTYRYDIFYHASFPDYDGPHSTPLLDGDRLFSVSIDGQVHAVDASNGDRIWTVDLCEAFGMTSPQSGYAASPLVWNGRLILPTIGKALPTESERFRKAPANADPREYPPGAVALDVETGDEVWRTESFRSSHASPVVVEIEGQPTAVFNGMFELLGVDPESGEILWRQLLRDLAADNVSVTPLWDESRSQFVLTHGYCDRGAQAIQVRRAQGRWETSRLWENSQMRVVHTNAVLNGETLLGTNREPTTLMVAIDVTTGRTRFRTRGFGKSNLLVVGDRVLVLDENGELVGCELGDAGLQELWRIDVLEPPAWTVPTLAGPYLLLRDLGQLKAYRFE